MGSEVKKWHHRRIESVRRELDGRYILRFEGQWGELWVESPEYDIKVGEMSSTWPYASMSIVLIVGERVIYDKREEFHRRYPEWY